MKFKLTQTEQHSTDSEFVPDLPPDIEFKTLEELMAFVEKHDVVIITSAKWAKDVDPEIEIYNDYRE